MGNSNLSLTLQKKLKQEGKSRKVLEPFPLPFCTPVLSVASLEAGRQAEVFITDRSLVCNPASLDLREESFKPSSIQKRKEGMADEA